METPNIYPDDAVIRTSDIEKKEEARQAAVDAAFGLWRDHDTNVSVDDAIRNLRNGRRF